MSETSVWVLRTFERDVAVEDITSPHACAVDYTEFFLGVFNNR